MLFADLLVFLVGLSVGSFLNVLVFRTHEGRPPTGRSRCATCRRTIAWYDLIPVASFFLLRGRCRRCQGEIAWQYPLVEAATGLLFFIVFTREAALAPSSLGDFFAATLVFLLRDFVFTAFLILVFVYDLRYMLIPDRFTIPAMLAALVFNVWLGVSTGSLLAGAVVIGGFFLAQYAVSRGTWVGDGDIRLGVLMGLMLGLRDGMVALFLAYVIGAAVGIWLLLARKASPKTPIAFGTFLSVGTFVALLWADPIVAWYVELFM
jgi:leader peptidase (prepilin peptidase)/N-methyltransferase